MTSNRKWQIGAVGVVIAIAANGVYGEVQKWRQQRRSDAATRCLMSAIKADDAKREAAGLPTWDDTWDQWLAGVAKECRKQAGYAD